ncbi:MAG: hypothetical protein HRU06_09095 [Oceanospirillaceae bacterium]|nr:hypothetical protein [Oceanospirillaceae bacterium]
MRLFISILLICLSLFNTHASSAQKIPLWTYYDFPPFIINTSLKTGLVYDLARLLSDQSQGKLQFNALYLPRKRLDQKLKSQAVGVVAFVSPLWFKGSYLWSPKLLLGRNEVISLTSQELEYTTPESLKNLHFTGLLGHKYPGIDKLVRAGRVKRSNVLNVKTALKTLLKGRTDAILLPRVAALYQVNKLGADALVYYSKQPQYMFYRHLLFQSSLHSAFAELTPFLTNLHLNPQWLSILDTYNLQSLVVSHSNF